MCVAISSAEMGACHPGTESLPRLSSLSPGLLGAAGARLGDCPPADPGAVLGVAGMTNPAASSVERDSGSSVITHAWRLFELSSFAA